MASKYFCILKVPGLNRKSGSDFQVVLFLFRYSLVSTLLDDSGLGLGSVFGLLPLFALNEDGYRRIIELSSQSYLKKNDLAYPHLDFLELLNDLLNLNLSCFFKIFLIKFTVFVSSFNNI